MKWKKGEKKLWEGLWFRFLFCFNWVIYIYIYSVMFHSTYVWQNTDVETGEKLSLNNIIKTCRA